MNKQFNSFIIYYIIFTCNINISDEKKVFYSKN